LEAAGFDGMSLPQGESIGLIAQELKKVFPELVSQEAYRPSPQKGAGRTEATSYQAVNYTRLVPVLLKAVQEQQTQIEQLKQALRQNGIQLPTSGK
jgi:hypothetical protein